jgi:hypothetical protein
MDHPPVRAWSGDRDPLIIALALAAFALAVTGSLAGPAAPADAYYLRTSDYLHFPAKAPNGEEFHYSIP